MNKTHNEPTSQLDNAIVSGGIDMSYNLHHILRKTLGSNNNVETRTLKHAGIKTCFNENNETGHKNMPAKMPSANKTDQQT